jgi:hypothetical protein
VAQTLSPISHLLQPLDAVLGSPGMVRVLRALIRHGGQLPLARLVRETKLSLPGALKVLNHLEGLGVVKVAGSGRARLYQAVEAHPIVAMLDGLFRAEAGYRGSVLDAVKAAGGGLGLKALWLFGSAARLEDRPDSDIDIVMVSAARDASEHERTAEVLRERLAGTPALTGLRPSVIALTMADVGSLIAEGHPIWAAAERDAKVLEGPSPQALAAEVSSRKVGDDEKRQERQDSGRSP